MYFIADVILGVGVVIVLICKVIVNIAYKDINSIGKK